MIMIQDQEISGSQYTVILAASDEAWWTSMDADGNWSEINETDGKRWNIDESDEKPTTIDEQSVNIDEHRRQF